ncbi:MAG: trehalase family glycosidase [Terracidiphilus sp.]
MHFESLEYFDWPLIRACGCIGMALDPRRIFLPDMKGCSMFLFANSRLGWAFRTLLILSVLSYAIGAGAQQTSRFSNAKANVEPESRDYQQLQQRLARGWNTWDAHSIATQVLLPEGLAIHVEMKHNTALYDFSNTVLSNVGVGKLAPGAEKVILGPHSWDGSYTDAQVSWQGHSWRMQTAHAGNDLVILATPLANESKSLLPPTIVFRVEFLWNMPGTALRHPGFIETHGTAGSIPIYCTCQRNSSDSPRQYADLPDGSPYFATDFTAPVGVSTGRARDLGEIRALIEQQKKSYELSVTKSGPIVDAIQTVMGWDTIYDPGGSRVITPVSRNWDIGWGGYVLFEWDTFCAATLASIGDRDLAYANAVEILREETPNGFVPNYARTDGWKSFDRSEPPIGALTVLNIFQKYHDRWFLQDTFAPLLRWNRWWSEHRDIQGYLAGGSDPDGAAVDVDDKERGTRQGAIYESGADNGPLYDDSVYDPKSGLLENADVGLMSLYIADCDALATIADTLGKASEAQELRDRGARYRAKLATLWDEKTGMFLNKDLYTGLFNHRLGPTNFYPLLAKAATPKQAKRMIHEHLLNPEEFWGKWVIPTIARNDPAFKDQFYWRGRIWGPVNYLVYLGLRNYDDPTVRREFAQKSYELFLQEWNENRHVHENYNAITGSGDDVTSSDRYYHWGALLGYEEYMEQSEPVIKGDKDGGLR